jgi:hypothetical protein
VPGLGTEPGQVLLIVGISGTQQLHCHLPVQQEVGGTPHIAHPAHGHPVVQPVPVSGQQTRRYRDGGLSPHGGPHYRSRNINPVSTDR